MIVQAAAGDISHEPVNYVIIANGSSFPYEVKSHGAPAGGKDVRGRSSNAPVLKIADRRRCAFRSTSR
jgi:hypothetical protein